MMGKSFVTASVGLVVGLVVALLLLAPRTRFTTWGLGVDSQTGAPSLDPLDMYDNDQVHWVTATSKCLYIETEQKIFAASVLDSTTRRYRVQCTANKCDSGALLTSLPPMPSTGYKYWQGLANTASPNSIDWYDGHIIIVKP